jgi:tetratricopeptide (TPR) repeat protein
MKSNDNRIEELKDDIIRYDKTIKRHPDEPNNYYLKAGALKELGLGQLTEDNSYYEQALECYSTAITLDPQSGLYLVDRSRLYVEVGAPEKAVQDMKKISELHIAETDPIFKIYIKNTVRDIARLDSIQNQIEQLQAKGEISVELANTLKDHAKVTATLVVQVGVHSEKLGEHETILTKHDERITSLVSLVKENTRLLDIVMQQLLLKEEKVLQTQINKLQQNIEIAKFQLKELQEEKVGRTELEPFAFKISEEISNDPKLKDYYDAIYDKLHSKIMEAIVVRGEHIAIDTTKIPVKVATKGVDLLISGITGMRIAVGEAISTGGEVYSKYSIKEKDIQLSTIASSPSARENIIKELAQQITLRNAERIINITQEYQEIKDWNQSSIIQAIQDKFVFNVDKNIYQKNLQKSLGCIDALKIVWAITKGMIKSSSTIEEVISQLLAVPTNYTLTAVKKLPFISLKIYSKIKVIPVIKENLLLHEDKIDIEDMLTQTQELSMRDAPTTSDMVPLEQLEDSSVLGDIP